jgi:para-aminobenzoate synthetase component 1
MFDELNRLGKSRTPLLFVIDYDMKNYYISPLSNLDPDIRYSIDKRSDFKNKTIPYHYKAVSKQRYEKAFNTIQEEIKKGNSYLTNLTFRSKLDIDYSLKEIYDYSDARFKLLFFDEFVSFSPERFIDIKNNTIYTYPMKGTIDAKIKDAKEKILANEKEMAEHTMVVDLLRNDLSIVSKKVRVLKFRYVEKIKAGERELLQVSSKIKGDLEDGWQDRLGDILKALLPAGSITGTPKKSTIDIIKKVEGYDRGFYSGVFGIFDGKSLDSGVMIRFIEKHGDNLYYKSGGGITIDSDMQSEYDEMCEKIYVPFL